MKSGSALLDDRELFPCPLCGRGLDIRQTKKKKPYVICDPCGVQLFIRTKAGMGRFEQLISAAAERNIWERLEQLQRQYQKKCPECGNQFWIDPARVKTSWMDGTFEGYCCPEKGCKGVARWEAKEGKTK